MKKPNSYRDLSKIPHGKDIRNHMRVLITMSENPILLRRFLEKTDEFIEDLIKEYSSEKLHASQFIGKNHYVAIVGNPRVPNEDIFRIGKEFGFTKKNIQIMNDLDHFKSGKYTPSLESDNCVAIILGEVPHSASGNIEKKLQPKVFHAKTYSNKLKFTKESLYNTFHGVLRMLSGQSGNFFPRLA